MNASNPRASERSVSSACALASVRQQFSVQGRGLNTSSWRLPFQGMALNDE
jgi:hypothetical protein